MHQAWHTTPLAPYVRVEVTAPPQVHDAALAREVERLWTQARRDRPRLFNGRVFCADHVARDAIVGHWTEYRLALAQIMRPALFDALRIRSLAVNGVLCSADGVVFGRRDPRAVYQPGLWQCPPAGSVESRDGHTGVDLAAQLMAELEEELGVTAAAIDPDRVRPLCAVEHPGSHVVDVGIALHTALTLAEIARLHAHAANDEYRDLCAVPLDRAADWLASRGDAVVPPARIFVAALAGA